MNSVTVGIISHKPGEMLERCLKSLAEIPAGIPYDLKLQAGEGTNAQNWNRLWKKCEGADFICMLEDDTAAIRPMWLLGLVETLRKHPVFGIVMPIETKDGVREDPGYTELLNATTRVAQTYGFCNLIRKGVRLEADESLTYFVDIDLAFQALEQGWELGCNGHVWMLHGAQNGRLSQAADIEAKQEKDKLYLQRKWSRQGK